MSTLVDQFGATLGGERVEGTTRSMLPSGVVQRWRMTLEARALTLVMLGLIIFGLVILYSASALTAMDQERPPHYYALSQAWGALGGLGLFAIIAKFDAERWKKLAWPIMIVAIVTMFMTLGGGNDESGGSQRFLFGASLQPAEFAKLAVVLWTPMLLVKKGAAVRHLGKGLGPFLLVIGVLSIIAIRQPDLSMAMTYCLLMAVILFAGGARTAHFVFLALLTVPLLVHKVDSTPYLRQRVQNFFGQDSTDVLRAENVGRQQNQSLIAVGSGGLFGVGLGEGFQQRAWTPLSFNDFIASVVGEELGFVGMTGLVLAFAAYGWLGFRIARQARSPFLTLVAIGLTYATVITAFIHIGVVIQLLPNTGLTLPFVSQGRSNLVLTIIMTGILVNIGSVRQRTFGSAATDPLTSSV